MVYKVLRYSALIMGVTGFPVLAEEVSPLAPISCLIEPDAVVQLSTAVAGIVSEVMADRGDRVKEGQIIARLDSRIEEIALALATARASNDTKVRGLEAQVAFLAAQAERASQLAARSAGSTSAAEEAGMKAEMARQDLDEARLAVSLSALERDQAAAALEQKTLRAPFDGVITERLLAPGEYREGAAHIATIARLDPLRVEAFAPLDYFNRISVGQTVTIRPEDPVGGLYPATVTIVDRVFDAATATFGIRMALANPDLALPAGLRCEVIFGPVGDKVAGQGG